MFFGVQEGKSLPLLAITVRLLRNLQTSFPAFFFFFFPGSPEEIKIPCVVFQVLSGSGSSSRLEEQVLCVNGKKEREGFRPH